MMGHVRNENSTQNFSRKMSGENSLRELGVDGRVICKWILEKHGVKVGTGRSGSGYGQNFAHVPSSHPA
jgi:hypothetical protein